MLMSPSLQESIAKVGGDCLPRYSARSETSLSSPERRYWIASLLDDSCACLIVTSAPDKDLGDLRIDHDLPEEKYGSLRWVGAAHDAVSMTRLKRLLPSQINPRAVQIFRFQEGTEKQILKLATVLNEIPSGLFSQKRTHDISGGLGLSTIPASGVSKPEGILVSCTWKPHGSE